MTDQLLILADAPSRKSGGRRIGYARVDSSADSAILTCWVRQLRAYGAIKVFTDVGALMGLRAAVGCLRVNDAVIYPEVCLHALTVGDIPAVFGSIPDGTALTFLERLPSADQGGVDMTSIRLQAREE
ncbi:hypothetical protein JQX09_20775 [Sulfitobacter pseudonitzschiae]|uniref:Uncharacterized protein n=1 Tax=Pseudosulfitobacter pseudonitzschiae TaxID=1402135 RepID=A0A9Q2RXD6_9RHOB|nr:hypothetical protein [Pseudosulfitobacter pseudonitzschiae]MBM2294362.1 hypothetical protein [Pseudosulfitobacter pseudonitzschiae]MBM2299287.1 hypothetical protein [Pseudosulfitobacter pseudonitzschiae]MBM2304194.1 hypothetical protein [Pseudosulfitobacter pseudonitzschiae]MBM2313974.1 hypothetical protein [Pseudosulfitobacter pseudonitzschiae]MBM2318889.1 hypothetical protein [Pseudosulfitobacter pseudonitzschiae]